MAFLFSRKNSKKKNKPVLEPIPNAVSKQKKIPITNQTVKPNIVQGIVQPQSTKCLCCGNKVHIKEELVKFKCSVCYTTNYVEKKKPLKQRSAGTTSTGNNYCSLSQLKQLIKKCYDSPRIVDRNGKEYTNYEIVSRYLTQCFHDIDILENSFGSINSSLFINIEELTEFYFQIMQLPTRKPFYRMICACNDLLKRPTERIERFRWILIIWQNPIVRSCLNFRPSEEGFEAPHIKAVGYELTKRCIGYMSQNLEKNSYQIYLTYLNSLPTQIFLDHIETINLYLTYQLTKVHSDYTKKSKHHKKTKENINQSIRLSSTASQPEPQHVGAGTSALLLESEEQDEENSDSLDSKSLKDINEIKKKQPRIRDYQYQQNWHIETASELMTLYFLVSSKRELSSHKALYKTNRISISHFYNMMLDFIDYRQDFNNWEGLEVKKKLHEIIQTEEFQKKKFSFCRYPFLLSLGVKISIMEFETRKIMEYQAEIAFLDSLDKGKNIPLYFKIQVRRKHIVPDSLKAIRDHQGDFLKALRVSFIGEEGIDAGGLRKEWFMLLTKEFFNRKSTLFETIPESRFSWFPSCPQTTLPENKNTEQLYFLFGVVIGLAIFNGVILDVSFPKVFYKKMCNEQLTFGDYLELYPETGRNLQKLLQYEKDDFAEIFALTFETTFVESSKRSNTIPKKQTIELCKNGSKREVTLKNVHEYIHLWVNYYLNIAVDRQFNQFITGFKKVFNGCNSIKLFNSEELERLLCGDIQVKRYDFDMLRSVTKYMNGFSDKSNVVEWFWEIVSKWDITLQSKLLQFVTGSDRVPATGINTLSFKISRLKGQGDLSLPIAHTCFNELSLSEYSSPSQLQHKLNTAITECQGFEFR